MSASTMDGLLSYPSVSVTDEDGTTLSLPRRNTLHLSGDITVTDDPVNDKTVIAYNPTFSTYEELVAELIAQFFTKASGHYRYQGQVSNTSGYTTIVTVPIPTNVSATLDVTINVRSATQHNALQRLIACSNRAGVVTVENDAPVSTYEENINWDFQAIASGTNVLLQVRDSAYMSGDYWTVTADYDDTTVVA